MNIGITVHIWSYLMRNTTKVITNYRHKIQLLYTVLGQNIFDQYHMSTLINSCKMVYYYVIMFLYTPLFY